MRTIAARIVVGADGLRSIVARRLGLAHPRRRPRRVAFVTHFRGVADIGTAGEMHVERDGYIGLADVGHGETNVALVVPAKLARGGDRAVFLSRWLDGHPHLAGRFRHAERTSPVVATGPFAHRTRRAWAPGAALVGDAAEFYDPFTGEGIYTALRSGELLAGYAHAALADPRPTHMARCLAAYDRCWRHEFRGKWAVERLVSAAVASPALLERAARALAGRRDLADLFVGVTGDFVPAREVLRPSYLLRLLFPGRAPAAAP